MCQVATPAVQTDCHAGAHYRQAQHCGDIDGGRSQTACSTTIWSAVSSAVQRRVVMRSVPQDAPTAPEGEQAKCQRPAGSAGTASATASGAGQHDATPATQGPPMTSYVAGDLRSTTTYRMTRGGGSRSVDCLNMCVGAEGNLRDDGSPASVLQRQMLEDVEQRRHKYAVRRTFGPRCRIRDCACYSRAQCVQSLIKLCFRGPLVLWLTHLSSDQWHRSIRLVVQIDTSK